MQPSEKNIELIEKAEKLGKWVGCNVDEFLHIFAYVLHSRRSIKIGRI